MAHMHEPGIDKTEPDLFGAVAAAEEKTAGAFKTISETADLLSLPQHVLRFWESKFAQIKPLKLRGGRRYYRPQDIEVLASIKHLLYKEGYTIKGARRAIAQVRKKPKDMPMMQDAPRKPRPIAAPIEDAPLFQALRAREEAASSSKKDDLRRIHGELLELRQLIATLPSFA